MPGNQSLLSYLVSFGVIALVIALRWRRMKRDQPLRLERLWIFPTILGAVAIVLFATHPPQGWAWAFCAAALGLGGALGWQRGKLMAITIDPVTHALNQRASPGAILFLVALIAARQGARGLAGTESFHLDPMAVTDVLLAFALGLFVVTRVEMYLRGRALLAAARAQGTGTA